MDLDPIYRRFAEYSYRRWYPARYPDALGPFADDVTEETLKSLEMEPQAGAAGLALEILQLLARMRHPDLVRAVQIAYSQEIAPGVMPSTAPYFLRAMHLAERVEIWKAWREWCEEFETPLGDWFHARAVLDARFESAKKQALSVFGIDAERDCKQIESDLRGSRDLFDYEMRELGEVATFADWLAICRFPAADSIADWNEFSALAQHTAQLFGIPKLPALKQAENDPAVQMVFPVDPPANVHLRFGRAAGPVDTLRFLQEFGRAAFYCGINPELPAIERTIGDPQLPHFWAYLYGLILTRPEGISRLVHPGADALAQRLRIALQFQARYDGALAVCRQRIGTELKEAQDIYAGCSETAFAFDPSHFLWLFDLDRSGESLYRINAFRAASAAIERLRTLFGNDWFASSRCAAKLAEYRYHGFQMTLQQMLLDLGVTEDPNYLIPIR